MYLPNTEGSHGESFSLNTITEDMSIMLNQLLERAVPGDSEAFKLGVMIAAAI